MTVDLGAGTGTGQGSDALTDVQGVVGSGFSDTLTGSSIDNTILGGAGNDTIDGAAGNDDPRLGCVSVTTRSTREPRRTVTDHGDDGYAR